MEGGLFIFCLLSSSKVLKLVGGEGEDVSPRECKNKFFGLSITTVLTEYTVSASVESSDCAVFFLPN